MFDVQILVNGNRCKQYNHQGRTFIQANHGSEYEIEIKNNYYKRILAVCSVDSLDVLTGKTADADAGGYIIDAYHPIRIKGFRVNDDEVGAFKFTCKGGSYAASKRDGSERNCGIIGVRLYYEVEPIVTYTTTTTKWDWSGTPVNPWGQPYTTCDSGGININYHSDVQYGGGGTVGCSGIVPEEPLMDYDAGPTYGSPIRSRGMGAGGQSARMSSHVKLCSNNPTPKGFDMGTGWGQKKESKVFTTDFNRGCLALSQDIYYASRESLIEMGVPITNELKVNLPQSFPDKYAKPPKGWNG